jgi:hypothetical protein
MRCKFWFQPSPNSISHIVHMSRYNKSWSPGIHTPAGSSLASLESSRVKVHENVIPYNVVKWG